MRGESGNRSWIATIASSYRDYRTVPLNDWEHMLIRDVLVHSKYYAISVFAILGVGIYAVRGHVPTLWLVWFLVACVIEGAIKVYVGEKYKRLSQSKQCAPCWRLVFDAGSVYSGVIYGLASLAVFYPMPDQNRLLLIGAFCSLVCILSAVTVFFPPVSRFMLSSLVTPMVVMLVYSGGKDLWLLALIIVITVLSIELLGRLTQNRYRHIARLNLENKALVESLSLQQSFAQKAQARAEQAVIDKSRFLATASHDLRQPLHALGLFHHALRQKSENETNQKLFESIEKSTVALNNMFNSLLDVSRLDANVVKPEYEAVSLESIFELLSLEFSPVASEKGLYCVCDYPNEIIYTDRTLFARILRNLISNAIKFTETGGVSIIVRRESAGLSILVSDTGHGIPDSERQKVFSEFYQLMEGDSQRASGVGLGLSIVHRLSALLDIDIKLDVAKGGGTEVRLLMATGVESCDSSPERESNSSDPGDSRAFESVKTEENLLRRCIVFIDDDVAIRDAMQSMLTQWGCIAVCVRDAEEGLQRLFSLALEPDAVVCDLHLANGCSGLDAIQLLREVLEQAMPAMLVSGASGADELHEIERAGFHCLTKPVSPENLKEAILDMLREQKADEVATVPVA
ncbi:hybrid sensor histidine kinase/response regulator [Granulosicoccus antarcticus]|nr:hybrid sensor histidine kinase/response regulator [Granulosicoccus antarcticus]